jgi:hypothetical protein
MACENNPLCGYKSIRFIRVRNPRLVTVYYGVIIGVFLYIALYTIWFERGYQKFDNVVGTTSSKVKGTAWIDAYDSNSSSIDSRIVYDSMDVITPSVEENALFITTAMIDTPNQTRYTCDGNVNTGSCDVDSDCLPDGTASADSQGIYNGICGVNGYCEVLGWCPLEEANETIAMRILHNIGNFTVFVKADVRFPDFRISRTNTLDKNDDGKPIMGYNLFTVNEILQEATKGGIKDVSEIADDGAIIMMRSQWNCNFDKPKRRCKPEWKFSRIDGEKNTISTGFNYRTVSYDPSGERRRLRKLFGIRIVFLQSGVGGRFDFAALTVTFGAGLSFLGIASLITDIVLESCLPESKKYSRAKMHSVQPVGAPTDDKSRLLSVDESHVSQADDRFSDMGIGVGGAGSMASTTPISTAQKRTFV